MIPGNRYITGKSFGGISFDSGYNFFPAWKLETWNSFCITANAGNRVYKTFINGKAIKISSFQAETRKVVFFFFQEVLGLTDYGGSHRKKKGNIFLLNAFFKDSGFSYPMKAGHSITATSKLTRSSYDLSNPPYLI